MKVPKEKEGEAEEKAVTNNERLRRDSMQHITLRWLHHLPVAMAASASFEMPLRYDT